MLKLLALTLLTILVFVHPEAGYSGQTTSTGNIYDKCTTQRCCETQATNCLGICSGVDTQSSAYGECVNICNRGRSNCLKRTGGGSPSKGTSTPQKGLIQ
jgi:hypothetical protein